jgi:hypothetical protein
MQGWQGGCRVLTQPVAAAFNSAGASRQNGIHVSPTFRVEGLVEPKMGRGDSAAQWVAQLRLG